MPRGLRASLSAVFTLFIAAGAVRAEPAAPGQVIGYAKADRSGASQVWSLPPDKPYLYVPVIPASFGGALEAVETGAEVGVALFKDPYFTSRDKGCQPTLGSTQRTDLAWLGATARFEPAPPGQASAPPTGSGDSYASMILYRTDLGPPPGALLMDRRSTLGLRCANPSHKTVYNRIFVPVAEAPETQRCFDLVGNYPGAAKPFQLDFINSDRLVLMTPGDMDTRYAQIRHDFTVTLYEGLACQGRSAVLDSRARIDRNLRLTQVEFRNRARSLHISYNYGNADAFLVRRAAPKTEQLAAPAAKTRPATPVLAAKPIQDPAIGGSQSEQPAAKKTLAPPLPRQAESQAAVASSQTQAPAPELGQAVTDRATTQSAQSAPVTAKRPGIPKLSPRMAPLGTQSAALPSGPKTFPFPVQDLFRLNHCLHWQKDCGEPAASAWCRAKGYSQASDWAVDPNIGSIFPTVVLGDQEICAKFACDGFKEITCSP